jgi:Family of unknown function (DUF6328)
MAAAMSNHPDQETEKLPLSKAGEHLLEECRMVLPGIQALFGFQLIVVFNTGFDQKLDPLEKILHLVAIGLVVVSTALVMTPAAFHRQTGQRRISQSFITLSSRLLLWSMAPLAVAVSLDFYLVAQTVLSEILSAALAAILFGVFAALWFVFPRSSKS